MAPQPDAAGWRNRSNRAGGDPMTTVAPRRSLLAVVIALLAGAAVPAPAGAEHAWDGYHWARYGTPFVLELGDNLTRDYPLDLVAASWAGSGAVVANPVAGGGCEAATAGRIEVCNGAYGATGWLGLTRIWVFADGHIAQAVVELNDSYFDVPAYADDRLIQHVLCQEVGHALGLDHQPAGAASCMASPWDAGPQPHPDGHDYAQLTASYAHGDEYATVAGEAAWPGLSRTESGVPSGIGDGDGWWARDDLFVQELGEGMLYTWVLWVESE